MLLAGKTALVTGVANRWSIAYAIASAFVREGATLVLTYQSERQKATVEDLGIELKAQTVLACDVTKPEELERLVAELGKDGGTLDIFAEFCNKPLELVWLGNNAENTV